MITPQSGVPTPQEPEITEEMVARAAQAIHDLTCGCGVSASDSDASIEAARAALRAGLAGRTVVELPEPDNTDDGIPAWHLRLGQVSAGTGAGEGIVRVPTDDYLFPAEAEQYGAALIAAAREARRLASESRKDEET